MCVVENRAVDSRPSQAGARKVSCVYLLAGEFRTVLANLLWIKADQYHHEFVRHHRKWTANQELKGLLDLVILLDPHFVEAYETQAYIYANGCGDVPKALRIVRQGISRNPRAHELYQIAAIFYASRLKDPRSALPYARLGLKYAPDDWYRTRARRLLRTVEEMATAQAIR
mgnify:FL=1